MKKIAATIGVFAWVLSITAVPVNAETDSETSAQTAFAGVPPAELPARAVSFVTQTSPGKQSETAIRAMKAAMVVNPSSVWSVLAAIVHAVPATAPDVAAAAVQAMPGQRLSLAKIATKNAPGYAARIASKLAGQDPQSAKLVAEAIAEVVPNAAQAIMLASTFPQTPATHGPGTSAEVNRGLNAESQGPPYQPGMVVPLVAALKIENGNTFPIYASP